MKYKIITTLPLNHPTIVQLGRALVQAGHVASADAKVHIHIPDPTFVEYHPEAHNVVYIPNYSHSIDKYVVEMYFDHVVTSNDTSYFYYKDTLNVAKPVSILRPFTLSSTFKAKSEKDIAVSIFSESPVPKCLPVLRDITSQVKILTFKDFIPSFVSRSKVVIHENPSRTLLAPPFSYLYLRALGGSLIIAENAEVLESQWKAITYSFGYGLKNLLETYLANADELERSRQQQNRQWKKLRPDKEAVLKECEVFFKEFRG